MPRPSSSAQGDGLRNKLVWITVFRTVAACLLLVALAIRVFPQAGELPKADALAFAVEFGVFALTLTYSVWQRWGRYLRALAWTQVAGDVAVASALVLLTGGPESPFSFLYLLAVISGAILLSNVGAMLTTGVSASAFCMVVLALQSTPDEWEMHSHLPPSKLLFSMALNLVSQALVAVLAVYLARQLSAAGGRLSAREADLKKLGELQRQILASMPSGLITCTREGRVTFINRAGRALLGLTENVTDVLTMEQLLPGFAGLHPGNLRAELHVDTAAGPRTLGLGVTELAGTSSALLVVFQDLTELRRAESALKRADELASLGKLSAQLAHEIRNPLASMRGSAQMLAEDLAENPTSTRLLQILVRESDRLEGLVENFLRFASPPKPSKELVNLDQLAAETLDLIQADPLSNGVELGRNLGPAQVNADPHQLRQVLLNLIRNALQAAGQGGMVKVKVEEREAAALLSVWDSAGKIPTEELSKIFEPFYTTRRGGTGLGLSTAQTIVSAHDGRIEVSSSPSAGTEFTICLPKATVLERKSA